MNPRFKNVLTAVVALSLITGSQVTAEPQKTYTVAVFAESGLSSAIQGRATFMEMFNAAAQRHKLPFKVNILVLKSGEELTRLIAKKQVDIVYATSRDFFVDAARYYNAKPFMQVLFNGQPTIKNCIYVAKESRYTDLKSLRGVKTLTYESRDMYYGLKKLLGERPEIYFGSLKVSPNGPSSAYAVSLGSAQAALIGDITLLGLRVTNPGPAKKIRSVACIQPLVNAPVFLVKPLDPKDHKLILSSLMDLQKENLKNDRALSNGLRFAKMFKLQFVPAKPGAFTSLLELYAIMEKEGAKTDYERWHRYAKGNQ